MIDFGMTKELTDAERHTLARSLVAVVEDDEEEMLTLAHEAGLRSKHMRPETLVYFVRFAWRLGLGLGFRLGYPNLSPQPEPEPQPQPQTEPQPSP